MILWKVGFSTLKLSHVYPFILSNAYPVRSQCIQVIAKFFPSCLSDVGFKIHITSVMVSDFQRKRMQQYLILFIFIGIDTTFRNRASLLRRHGGMDSDLTEDATRRETG